MSVFDKGLITILVTCAVFSVVSIPLVLRKVPRNPVYGYRTRATLSDDKVWYEVNTYFGSRFLVASVLSACIAVAIHIWGGIPPATYLKVSVVLLVAPVVAAWLLTARFVRDILP
jgi:uncharacterized membrane protein